MRTTSLSPRFMMTLLATGVALAFAAPVEAAPGRTLASTDWGDDAPVRAAAANSATYSDASGDGGAGPDLANITVSNDDAGTITFRIELPNRPTLPEALDLQIAIDADFNPGTGDPYDGAEYVLVATGEGYGLGRWNGSAWEAASFTTLNADYSAGVLTFTINASDLGGTADFLFWVGVDEDPASSIFTDVAPEVGRYMYFLAT
jgi:hypothetical protein